MKTATLFLMLANGEASFLDLHREICLQVPAALEMDHPVSVEMNSGRQARVIAAACYDLESRDPCELEAQS